jgi:hypothetical protein
MGIELDIDAICSAGHRPVDEIESFIRWHAPINNLERRAWATRFNAAISKASVLKAEPRPEPFGRKIFQFVRGVEEYDVRIVFNNADGSEAQVLSKKVTGRVSRVIVPFEGHGSFAIYSGPMIIRQPPRLFVAGDYIGVN